MAEAMRAGPAVAHWKQLPGIVQHGFTHFRLELALLAGATAEPVEGIWAKPSEFGRYALPTLTKKAIRHAQSALRS
jgi:A/G-specific adenine glycosylase